jgi:RNA polymerase sigma factor (sigma-70 family)
LGDCQLVVQACKGDDEAFCSLVRKYANAVYGVAYHSVGDFHQAQDIAQEVFLTAYLKLHTLKEPEKVGSWLYGITKHRSLDWHRANGRRQEYELGDTMYAPIADLDTQISVRNALNTLPKQTRLLVTLYHIAGYKTKELANFLGISTEAVESRLRRARKTLKKELLDMVEEGLNKNKLCESFYERIQGLVNTYDQLIAVGKWEEALDVIQEAVQIDPNDMDLHHCLAHSLSMVGANTGNAELLDKSEKVYLKLAEVDPNQYSGLGFVYLRQKKYKQAIDCFKKLTKYHADGLIPLGHACLANKEYEEAEKAYQSAIAQGMSRVSIGLRGLAKTAKAIGDNERALRCQSVLIDVLSSLGGEPLYHDRLWKAYVKLAQLQVDEGDIERTLKSLTTALPIVLDAMEDSPSTLFDKLTFSTSRTKDGTDLDWFVKDLASPQFAALKGNEVYGKLVSEAKALAGAQDGGT